MAWNDPSVGEAQVKMVRNLPNSTIGGVAGGTAPIESQLERLSRLCKSLAELNNQLGYINTKVRGQVPQDGRIEKTPEAPELTLLNLSRIAEALVERCHIEVNELAAQIGS